MKMDERTVKFKRTLKNINGSFNVTIPPELIDFLNGRSEEQITLIGDVNSKGQKYVAIFIEKNE